jgi:hypothetical protein
MFWWFDCIDFSLNSFDNAFPFLIISIISICCLAKLKYSLWKHSYSFLQWINHLLLLFFITIHFLYLLKTLSLILVWQFYINIFSVIFSKNALYLPIILKLSLIYHMSSYDTNFMRLTFISVSRISPFIPLLYTCQIISFIFQYSNLQFYLDNRESICFYFDFLKE